MGERRQFAHHRSTNGAHHADIPVGRFNQFLSNDDSKQPSVEGRFTSDNFAHVVLPSGGHRYTVVGLLFMI